MSRHQKRDGGGVILNILSPPDQYKYTSSLVANATNKIHKETIIMFQNLKILTRVVVKKISSGFMQF